MNKPTMPPEAKGLGTRMVNNLVNLKNPDWGIAIAVSVLTLTLEHYGGTPVDWEEIMDFVEKYMGSIPKEYNS